MRIASSDLSLSNERFRDAVADISVRLHGGRKDDLLLRDTRQKQILWRGLAGIATVLMALVAPLDMLQERAAQLVDPLDPAERARLVPSAWERLKAWLASLRVAA